jgi:hypothetical protein
VRKLEVDIGVFGETELKRDKKKQRHWSKDNSLCNRCYTSIAFPSEKGKSLTYTCEGRERHKGPHFATYGGNGEYIKFLWPTGKAECKPDVFGIDGGRW